MSGQHKGDSTTSHAALQPPRSDKIPITGEPLPEGFTAIFEPNKLEYNDGKGVRHSIHMPTGTFRKAIKYYEDENWDELAKHPAWGMSSLTW